SWVNSAAMNAADVNARTPDPPGGAFERDATGGMTGRAMETAVAPFRAKITDRATPAERQAGVKTMTKLIAASGITSVHDPQGSPEDLAAYQDAMYAGELSVRVYCFLNAASIPRMLSAGVHTGLGDDWVRVGAMKLVCDGSISERTAFLADPYVG